MGYSYENAMSVLIEYAKNQGFKDVELNFDDISMVTWGDLNTPDTIKIEEKHPIEIKVYILLHELGHHELRKDWGKFEQEMPIIAKAEMLKEYKLKRRIGYYVSCLEEEYMSWDSGYVLGKFLGIEIDDKKWMELKNKCLMGYIRFFGKK
jgi:hypothetical protein